YVCPLSCRTIGASDVCWMRHSSAIASASARASMFAQPSCQRRTAYRIMSAPPPHTHISIGRTNNELNRVAPGSTSATTGASNTSVSAGRAPFHPDVTVSSLAAMSASQDAARFGKLFVRAVRILTGLARHEGGDHFAGCFDVSGRGNGVAFAISTHEERL